MTCNSGNYRLCPLSSSSDIPPLPLPPPTSLHLHPNPHPRVPPCISSVPVNLPQCVSGGGGGMSTWVLSPSAGSVLKMWREKNCPIEGYWGGLHTLQYILPSTALYDEGWSFNKMPTHVMSILTKGREYDVHYPILKGSVTRDFLPLFFPWFEPIWASDKEDKIFSIRLRCKHRDTVL